jgi:hypothetical protein
MIAAPFSAIMIVGALVLVEVTPASPRRRWRRRLGQIVDVFAVFESELAGGRLIKPVSVNSP